MQVYGYQVTTGSDSVQESLKQKQIWSVTEHYEIPEVM